LTVRGWGDVPGRGTRGAIAPEPTAEESFQSGAPGDERNEIEHEQQGNDQSAATRTDRHEQAEEPHGNEIGTNHGRGLAYEE
jgi:hypothetical protein